MTQTVRVLLLLLSVSLTFAATPGAGAETRSRIVGGTPVAPGSYPWMAAIVSGNEQDTYRGFICGGSLIESDYVLTASHCVVNQLGVPLSTERGPLDIVLEATKLGGIDGQRISVEKIIPHPLYDVALLKLRGNATTTPVEMAAPGTSLADAGAESTVTGWGLTSENGSRVSRWLREVTVPIVSSLQCRGAYPRLDKLGEICAGLLDQGGKDACQGDSGGPLFVERQTGGQSEYVQVGIVSYGHGCARRSFPGVYTRVSTIRDWVIETVANGGVQTPVPDYNLLRARPNANFTVRCNGLECIFDARNSTPAKNILRYIWQTDDKPFKYGRRIKYTYDGPGVYRMSLFLVSTDDESDGYKERARFRFRVSESGRTRLLGEPVTHRWLGNLQPGGRVVVPGKDGFRLAAGKLLIGLAHGKRSDFDVSLQVLNKSTVRWTTLSRSKTVGTPRERISLNSIEAGRYRMIVTARSGDGIFDMIATQP